MQCDVLSKRLAETENALRKAVRSVSDKVCISFCISVSKWCIKFEKHMSVHCSIITIDNTVPLLFVMKYIEYCCVICV